MASYMKYHSDRTDPTDLSQRSTLVRLSCLQKAHTDLFLPSDSAQTRFQTWQVRPTLRSFMRFNRSQNLSSKTAERQKGLGTASTMVTIRERHDLSTKTQPLLRMLSLLCSRQVAVMKTLRPVLILVAEYHDLCSNCRGTMTCPNATS